MLKYLLGIAAAVVIVLAIGFGGFYFGQKQVKENLIISPTPTTTLTFIPTQLPSATKTPTSIPLTPQQLKEEIVSALGSKSYSKLESLMTPTVVVILQATECCGLMSSTDAIAQMSYINAATPPWNFDQTNPTIVSIKTNNPENYGDSILGISANNYVVAFGLNSENKISKISMAVHYNLLVP